MAPELFPRLLDGFQETLAVGYLTRDLALVRLQYFSDQRPNHVDLPLRGIVTKALALNARTVIVAHDHPIGNCRPSKADIDATRRLARLCRDVDIALYDHVIVAGLERFSFREQGFL